MNRVPARRRAGMTLVEVVVAMMLLGGVLLGLGSFTMQMSQAASRARLRAVAAQLASDRLETVKGAPRYSAIDSMYVATEASVDGHPGYTRQTMVTHVGGAAQDSVDYRIVTVEVRNAQLPTPVRKTTIIAPF